MDDRARILGEVLAETWEPGGDARGKNGVYLAAGPGRGERIATCAISVDAPVVDEARARLISVAPEALRILITFNLDAEECAMCGGMNPRNGLGLLHDEGCEFIALMRKAGLR